MIQNIHRSSKSFGILRDRPVPVKPKLIFIPRFDFCWRILSLPAIFAVPAKKMMDDLAYSDTLEFQYSGISKTDTP